MYSILFDLNQNKLRAEYPGDSAENAYAKIKRFLVDRGFTHRQRSVYFGDADMDAVHTVITAAELSEAFPWLAPSVSDIRMLRIVGYDDLMPAIKLGKRAGLAALTAPTSQLIH